MELFPRRLIERAEEAVRACRSAGLMVATAESCTGGLIAGCLTAVSGSSDAVERGFVTYANEAKREMLGVRDDLLAAHGAVSEACARAMAEGALARSRAQIAVSVTGIAGPGGGTDEKPVGLVHLAAARTGCPTRHVRHVFLGDRTEVRLAAVDVALTLIREAADAPTSG